MNEWVDNLSAYIKEHPPGFRAANTDSVLDALFWVYTESNRLDNSAVQDGYTRLHQRLNGLPLDELDEICDIVYDITSNREISCFAHGIIVGMRLEQELRENE